MTGLQSLSITGVREWSENAVEPGAPPEMRVKTPALTAQPEREAWQQSGNGPATPVNGRRRDRTVS